MDHLKICMDALRLLARLPEFDTNRLYLAEQRIKEYLQSEAHRPLTASLAMSVVRQFETDGGVIYGSDRLIWF